MQVKEALISGGITRSNKPDGVRSTPGIKTQEDLVSHYCHSVWCVVHCHSLVTSSACWSYLDLMLTRHR